MTSGSVNARVQKHRDALRKAGLRPVQLWVTDTRQPNFVKEYRRQSRLVGRADKADAATSCLLDATFADVEGWTS